MNDPKLNRFYEQEYIEEKLKEMVPAGNLLLQIFQDLLDFLG